MKHLKFGSLLVALLLAFTTAGFAQLATQENLSEEDIRKAINELASKNDEASKAQLLIEAQAFEKSDLERNQVLAASLYNFLGDESAANNIRAGILEKFPRGVTARDQELRTLFTGENAEYPAAQAQYEAWIAKFPPSSFQPSEQYAYLQAATLYGRALVKANQFDAVTKLVRDNESASEYYHLVINLGQEMHKAGQYQPSLPLFEAASRKIAAEEDRVRLHDMVYGLYADALVQSGQVEKGIAMAEEVIERSGRNVRANDVLTVARGYAKTGKNQEAFQTLENYLVNHSTNQDILNELEKVYPLANGANADYAAYRASLDGKIKAGLKEKYRSSMVKKEAPQFSMQNMKGETVSLSDMKGKIVVLDFWATWCGPCIISFPGMQAAVNKYAADPNVEFLFINTWQTEENYVDLVTDFIAENQYTFHVLYDEMKERDKATVTAYGIQGIPTKVFIDGDGFIRFQTAGGNADVSQVVGEIEAKIELIKEQKGE